MEKSTREYSNIDEYIGMFSEDVQEILKNIRETIKESAPEAEEGISYNMAVFKLNGNLVYFAACKNHIGFYPTPSAIDAFKEELKQYKTSKGAIQFPVKKPIPFDLIRDIVRYRVNENISGE